MQIIFKSSESTLLKVSVGHQTITDAYSAMIIDWKMIKYFFHFFENIKNKIVTPCFNFIN